MNAVEFRFYQGIVDALDHPWFPEVYYTLAHGEKVPSYLVSVELIDGLAPLVGCPMTHVLDRQAQEIVDRVLYDRTMRREILIWTNEDCNPMVIDGARAVRMNDYVYRIAPMLDRTDIMREVIESLDKRLESLESFDKELEGG